MVLTGTVTTANRVRTKIWWSNERMKREVARQVALVKARATVTSYGGKVRRLLNGLLDVARKGKYTKL